MCKYNLESHAYIKEDADALSVGVTVGIFVAVEFLGVDTALLVSVGHYVAVVEDVVHAEVEVEADFTVYINHLSDRRIEGESVFKLVLSGELADFSFECSRIGIGSP